MSEWDPKDIRDRRAAVIAELLRMGHAPAKISEALKIADAGGSVAEALSVLSRHETEESGNVRPLPRRDKEAG